MVGVYYTGLGGKRECRKWGEATAGKRAGRAVEGAFHEHHIGKPSCQLGAGMKIDRHCTAATMLALCPVILEMGFSHHPLFFVGSTGWVAQYELCREEQSLRGGEFCRGKGGGRI